VDRRALFGAGIPGFGIELRTDAAELYGKPPEGGVGRRTIARGLRWPPYA